MIRFHEHDGKLYRHESEVAGHAAVWHRDGWRWVEHVPPQAKSLSARTAAARTGGKHDDSVSSFADIPEPVTESVSAARPETVTVVFDTESEVRFGVKGGNLLTAEPTYKPGYADDKHAHKPAKKKAAKKRAKKKAARKKRSK